MITDVRNHASMGAGCTVWLDRGAVTEFVMAEGDEEVTRVLERGAEVRFTVPEEFWAGWKMIGGLWGRGERGGGGWYIICGKVVNYLCSLRINSSIINTRI